MRASATAFPIPLPAPVTIATFSVEAMNEPSALLVGRLGYHEPRVTVFIERDLESQEIGVLSERDAATVDPLGPQNPLIFSAGPFAGTSFSNANRTSVGCKSPLTGGVKEANGGGTFSYALGQLKIAGFTLRGAAADWVVLHFKKDGSIAFDDARPYLGKGNFEAGRLLQEKYGKKVAYALCGPVGEYQGLIAGIAFTDKDGRPSRLDRKS